MAYSVVCPRCQAVVDGWIRVIKIVNGEVVTNAGEEGPFLACPNCGKIIKIPPIKE